MWLPVTKEATGEGPDRYRLEPRGFATTPSNQQARRCALASRCSGHGRRGRAMKVRHNEQNDQRQ